MHLNHILEAANVDTDTLTARARAAGCRGALVVGGSLADGLGTELSDVDLVAFEPSADGPDDGQRVAISRHQWGRLTVDLHRVAVPTLVRICAPYREHLLAAPDRPLPRLPYEILVLLHAIHAGLPIAEQPRVAELADTVGADLFPALLGLRALGSFLHHYRDGRQLRALLLTRPALAAGRGAAEAAADAALALSGRVNPNPKWRVLLLENAARDPRSDLLAWSDLLDVIMDPASAGDAGAVLAIAAGAAGAVAERTELAIYHEAGQVRALAAETAGTTNRGA
jgi:hypothetical protein